MNQRPLRDGLPQISDRQHCCRLPIYEAMEFGLASMERVTLLELLTQETLEHAH
jgi:hypothetical protein